MKKYISVLLLTAFSWTCVTSVYAQDLTDGDPSNDVCVDIQNTLRYRATDATTNGEVSALQDFLADKGYLSGQPTGYYGRLTVIAVQKYQRSVGVSPTGNVGALTRSLIKKETCTAGTNTQTPVSTVPSTPTIPVVACTMDYRSCPDGSAMPRDANCTWRSDKCPTTISWSQVPEIKRFTISSSGVNGAANLMWDTSNVTSCNLWGGSTPNDNNTLLYSAYPGGSYTVMSERGDNKFVYFNLECANKDSGKTTKAHVESIIKINATVSAVPSISFFSASKATIAQGEGVVLSWSADKNTSNCNILRLENNSGRFMVANNVGTASTYTVYPSVTTKYYLQCLGFQDGSGKDAANVEFPLYVSVTQGSIPKPTCVIKNIYPTPPLYPMNVTVIWNASNATYGQGPYGDGIDINGQGTYPLNQMEIRNLTFKFFNVNGDSTTCTTTLDGRVG